MLVMSPNEKQNYSLSHQSSESNIKSKKNEDIDNDVDFQLLRHPCIVSKNPSADSGIQSVQAFLEILQFLSLMTITMVKLVCQ